MKPIIRQAEPCDAKEFCCIYNHYISYSTATFEENPVTEEIMRERIYKVTTKHSWWTALDGEKVIGYAYLHNFHERSAYRRTLEDSVYVHKDYAGQGIGGALLEKLLEDAQAQGAHSVIAILGHPNVASETLHEKFGFTKIAHIKDAGYKFEKWVDVTYYQKVLE
jgi:phosphinothricin acetyltransferase